MKKCIAFLLALAVMVGLCACTASKKQNQAEPTNESTTAATTEPTVLPAAATAASAADPTEIPTEATPELATDGSEDATAETTAVLPTEEPTEATLETTADDPTEVPPTAVPTEVPHSDLYVTGVSPDQMIAYFNEVILDTESDGDVAMVQKWDRPVYYRIEGVPSQRDAQIISKLTKELNSVEGFPGIRAATGLEQNLIIYFLREEEFKTQFAHLLDGQPADGAMQIWSYNDTNNIYTGRIGYRKDAAQDVKDSVIPEELLKVLGISNTALREDSIVYQSGNEVNELSDVDWAIIRLLYHPNIQCGMNAAQCEAIIRKLYY